MPRILYCFISAVIGAVSGALCFGTYLAIFFRVYSLFFGPFPLFEIAFLGTVYVTDPYREGLIVGGIIGALLGLFAGLIIGIRQPISLPRAAVNSIISTGLFFLVLAFLLDMPSVLQLILDPDALTRSLPTAFIFSLFFLVPSAASGAIVHLINRSTATMLKLKHPVT